MSARYRASNCRLATVASLDLDQDGRLSGELSSSLRSIPNGFQCEGREHDLPFLQHC